MVIGIIIGLQRRGARAPTAPAPWASAWLTKLAVFGRIPTLLSDDTAPSYDADAARDKINQTDRQAPPPRQRVNKSPQTRPVRDLRSLLWSMVLITTP